MICKHIKKLAGHVLAAVTTGRWEIRKDYDREDDEPWLDVDWMEDEGNHFCIWVGNYTVYCHYYH